MKKLILITLSALPLFFLCSCGNDKSEEDEVIKNVAGEVEPTVRKQKPTPKKVNPLHMTQSKLEARAEKLVKKYVTEYVRSRKSLTGYSNYKPVRWKYDHSAATLDTIVYHTFTVEDSYGNTHTMQRMLGVSRYKDKVWFYTN